MAVACLSRRKNYVDVEHPTWFSLCGVEAPKRNPKLGESPLSACMIHLLQVCKPWRDALDSTRTSLTPLKLSILWCRRLRSLQVLSLERLEAGAGKVRAFLRCSKALLASFQHELNEGFGHDEQTQAISSPRP